MAGWKTVGAILKSKDPSKGKYIKIKEDITLKKGDFLQIFDPRKNKNATEEQLAKIPDYVVADIVLAPPKD